MKYLVDTNLLSEPQRARPDPAAVRFLEQTDPKRLFVSVVTLGEVTAGIRRLTDERRRRRLADWIGAAKEHFGDRLLTFDADCAEAWGDLTARALDRGIGVSVPDAMLAATAAHHGLVVATRNVRDFEPLGTRTLNPWQG